MAPVLMQNVESHSAEIAAGQRFEFGKNWTRFLSKLSDDRISAACQSLLSKLDLSSLEKKSFLDVGSGSGLFSLAARKLGATVRSFDYDPFSVRCTEELRRRYYPDSSDWKVEHGSALDRDYLASLGTYDVVYSWGVLHHTGDMWAALENVVPLVKPGGLLFIAIYNDLGSRSKRWLKIKKAYNRLPPLLRGPFAFAAIIPSEFRSLLDAALHLRTIQYFKSWFHADFSRGMNKWTDVVDWVGGYPYEYAAPEEIFLYYKKRGFSLENLRCKGVGLGCNEFVLRRTPA
jgi:2-polyprenyl-6-hydroxyphenyl methylase/3-demethylubiquinone-9 3-methyltransferase